MVGLNVGNKMKIQAAGEQFWGAGAIKDWKGLNPLLQTERPRWKAGRQLQEQRCSDSQAACGLQHIQLPCSGLKPPRTNLWVTAGIHNTVQRTEPPTMT